MAACGTKAGGLRPRRLNLDCTLALQFSTGVRAGSGAARLKPAAALRGRCETCCGRAFGRCSRGRRPLCRGPGLSRLHNRPRAQTRCKHPSTDGSPFIRATGPGRQPEHGQAPSSSARQVARPPRSSEPRPGTRVGGREPVRPTRGHGIPRATPIRPGSSRRRQPEAASAPRRSPASAQERGFRQASVKPTRYARSSTRKARSDEHGSDARTRVRVVWFGTVCAGGRRSYVLATARLDGYGSKRAHHRAQSAIRAACN